MKCSDWLLVILQEPIRIVLFNLDVLYGPMGVQEPNRMGQSERASRRTAGQHRPGGCDRFRAHLLIFEHLRFATLWAGMRTLAQK